MVKYIVLGSVLLLVYNCNQKSNNQQFLQKKKSHPSHIYTYVDIKKDTLNYYETNYVPVYSEIYHVDGTQVFHLTSTISIRNTSLKDSAYIFSAVFYDSYGEIISEYVDSTILLTPLETIEFVVEEYLNGKGPGDNFIVEWGARAYTDQLLIQSVMIGTYDRQGISFKANAKVIERSHK